MCERKKERNFKKERRKERQRKKRQRKKTKRKKKRTNERTDGRTNARTNESTLARLLDESCFVVCRSTVKKYWSLLLLKSRGDSKRELGIKFNSPKYFIANVSLIPVRAHVYERYVNFASYCTAKKMYFHQTCKHVILLVDPEHHILAWLMKVMHDDRKCILSVMICKPLITVQDKKKTIK